MRRHAGRRTHANDTMTGTDTKKALGAPRNKMALLNEVAAAPNTTHAGGQYGEG